MCHSTVSDSFAVVLAFVVALAGCGDGDGTASNKKDVDPKAEEAFVERLRPQVTAFCADCHAMPRPENFRQKDWHKEVKQGYDLYKDSGRSDLDAPPFDDVLRYFELQAPEALTLPATISGSEATTLVLRPAEMKVPPDASPLSAPAVAHIKWMDLGLKGAPALVYCDLKSGMVAAAWPQRPGMPAETLATLKHAAHAEPYDLDGDKRVDLVAADMGSFEVGDHDKGRVVWLRRHEVLESFDVVVLREGLGRVADVRPGDFNGDGKPDLVVAEFGWRKTGRILLLENQGPSKKELLEFTLRVIDPRHGAIHVPPIDLNGDGHLDFIALISQEYEAIEAYLNRGDGEFDRQTLWQAEYPSYGSSGIELVDLDGDGDVDVLYANGDSFDSGQAKPYHSVQWLENRGSLSFTHHHLTHMPGVHSAKPGDLDGDGDLDVVAVAMLPKSERKRLNTGGIESVVLLEQTSRGKFRRTKIEVRSSIHAALEVADFDSNGRPDLAVGNFFFEGDGDNSKPSLTIHWNAPDQKKKEGGSAPENKRSSGKSNVGKKANTQ